MEYIIYWISIKKLLEMYKNRTLEQLPTYLINELARLTNFIIFYTLLKYLFLKTSKFSRL